LVFIGGGRRKEDCCGGGGEGFGRMRLDVGFRLSRSALEASLCCLMVLMVQCQDTVLSKTICENSEISFLIGATNPIIIRHL
jgi:hypothetical protein